MLQIRSKLDFFQANRACKITIDDGISPHKLLTWEEHVHELAVGGSGAHLLYLGHLSVQAFVDPGQHLMPGKGNYPSFKLTMNFPLC